MMDGGMMWGMSVAAFALILVSDAIEDERLQQCAAD